MRVGDYVQHRKTERRGELLDLLPDGDWIVYSPNLGPLSELWRARDIELTRLLRKGEIE